MLSPIFISFCSVLAPGSQESQESQDLAPQALLEAEVVERQRQRVTYFGRDRNRPSPAQVSLEYGELGFGSEGKSLRWSTGKDYWSTLDTNADLTIAGKKVPPGHYYLVLEKGKRDAWSLVILESAKIRRATMDAFQAMGTKGGIKALLTTMPALEEPQSEFSVRLLPKQDKQAVLDIRWGPYHLTAPLELALPKR